MHLCYLDESGTPELGSNTSHFVLLGIAIPADSWKEKDRWITRIKQKFDLEGEEIHTAWIVRDFAEQRRVPQFESMSYAERRRAVLGVRSLNLSRPRRNSAQARLLSKYKKSEAYVHLSRDERRTLVRELADLVGAWDDAVIFFEAQDKARTELSPQRAFDYAFEQLVSRFNTFLGRDRTEHGLFVQDNNQTVCRRLTANMRRYHREGTFWTDAERIVETPLFVDSQLTAMVQVADLCGYAVRRFFEREEPDLFDRIYPRIDRNEGKLVGARHYTARHECRCRVCLDHGRYGDAG